MIPTPLNLYPRALQNRISGREPSLRAPRLKFLKAAGINFLLLQILFLCLFAYIFGSLYQQGGHVHNLNIVYVDYDGGIIGQSILDAYHALEGQSFPTLQPRTAEEFPTPGDLREAVCKTKFWAALYTVPGASQQLESALSGGPAAAAYNQSDVLTYIWNEARYSTVIDTSVSANLVVLASVARNIYIATNGTGALQTLNTTSAAAVSIFGDPWHLSNVNIQPTSQGSRLIYNTLVIILILIQEFFYLGTINGLYMQFKLYSRLYPHRLIIYRAMISLSYTLVGSLCVSGMIWAYRAGWQVNGNQFALTWASLWLFAHVNFLWLDVFTVWSPPQFVPMFLITWVVLNVTSILLPFELSPGFYKWSYAMPAHEVYQTLIDIWSSGCNPQLRYALPILFAWEVVGWLLSALGVYRRCHFAVIAEEAQEAAFKERIDVAMAFERKRDAGRKELREHGDLERVQTEAEAEEKDREELGEAIRMQDTQLQKEKTKAERNCNFGPTFNLAYKTETN